MEQLIHAAVRHMPGTRERLFPTRIRSSPHLSARRYAQIVRGWGSGNRPRLEHLWDHRMRRTKASLIYRRTKNLRAVQLLLGHTRLESTGKTMV
jgi:site-specific recombinase XerC